MERPDFLNLKNGEKVKFHFQTKNIKIEYLNLENVMSGKVWI